MTGPALESWTAVREGLADGAAAAASAVIASTLPELLQDDAADAIVARGIPAVAGLRTSVACVEALERPWADPARLRAIAAACAGPSAAGGAWLGEAEAKALLRDAGVAVPAGRPVAGEDDAVACAAALGGPVAVKATSAALRHKSDAGALVLGVEDEAAIRAAFRRVTAAAPGAAVLVEAMAPPGVELLVAARRDAVVPALVLGLGGIWTEALDDVAIVPLPATPARVEAALVGLRGAGLLAGGRGTPGADVAAVARLAARAGEVLLKHGLALLELNPVIAGPHGAVAVDALARAGT